MEKHISDDKKSICTHHDDGGITIQEIKTAEEARQFAIEWQKWVSDDQSLSYGELAGWQGYFLEMVEKFPELKEEFEENGII
jgi:hypothetical protein